MSEQNEQQGTHKPTPRRVEEFRKRGDIARSRDLSAAITMGAGAAVGFMLVDRSIASIGELTIRTFSELTTPELSVALIRVSSTFVKTCLPVTLGALGGYFVQASAQLGFPPAFAGPKVDFARFFSFDGLFQLFNLRESVERTLKALAKLLLVGLAGSFALLVEYRIFTTAPALEAPSLSLRLIAAVGRLSAYACSSFLLLGIVEYGLERRKLNRRMMMTTEEIKREMREMEGDPHVKRARKQRMRELARRRLTAAVQKADVVVVNPTEYAVALRYRAGVDAAPRVVAKGRRSLAERIRQIARSAGVPILAQPPLARLLYKVVPEGREVPANVYKAVAEVLAYVYRLKRGVR